MTSTDQLTNLTELTVPQSGVTVSINQYWPESSDNRPVVTCAISHDVRSISLRFRSRGERFVRCKNATLQSPVWQDSCVEFFVMPTPAGYFNFEFNCMGAMLLTYVRDWRRESEHSPLLNAEELSAEQVAGMTIEGSVKGPLPEEIAGPLDWTLNATIPLSLMEPFTGRLGELPGSTWRANFQTCAQFSSHPYWAAWTPLGPVLNFHQPSRFGRLTFT